MTSMGVTFRHVFIRGPSVSLRNSRRDFAQQPVNSSRSPVPQVAVDGQTRNRSRKGAAWKSSTRKSAALSRLVEGRFLNIGPTTLEIYSKTWWDERTAAVSAVVDLVMKSDEVSNDGTQQQMEETRQMLFEPENAEPIGAPTGAPAP